MAEASIPVAENQFNCSVCLQLLKEPVTIPCGHSFCMICINRFWDVEKLYSCPQCRQTFSPRPVLHRNNLLAELVKTLQQTVLQKSFSQCLDSLSSGDEDVECDSCVGEKNKAAKTCLTCLASYCDIHLQPHHESATFKKHQLVPPFRNLQEKTCPQHDKLLEVFCKTDEKIICSLCLLDQHKGHNTVSIQEQWMEKKKHFEDIQMKYKNRRDRRENIQLELKEQMESLKCSAQAAVQDSEEIFTELIKSIEKKRSETTELIRAREKAELERAAAASAQLLKEIVKLDKKHTELVNLSHSNDYFEFVQRSQVLCADLEPNDTLKIGFSQKPPFENFKTSVLQLKDQLESFCIEEWKTVSENVNVQIITAPEPETREEFLKYACVLTLDPNTAHCNLLLLEMNTKVICDDRRHLYPDHPERFSHWQQVLCEQCVSPRSYWEAELGGENGASIAVSSKSIKRKRSENESRFGHNKESFRLVRYPSKYIFWDNNTQIEIPGPTYKRIGVYLNEKAGTLSFYGVSSTMTLIHKVTTEFTRPMYAGFGLGSESFASICIFASSSATGENLKKKKK